MAVHLQYFRDTFRPGDDLIPGNSTSNDPVEFDLVPAEGADLARLKSMLAATVGITQGDWGPTEQAGTIAAYETGPRGFVNTVTAVRGLTVPAAMAVRVGLISQEQMPKHVPPGAAGPVANDQAQIPITNGFMFSRVCGFMELLALTLQVVAQIVNLSNKAQIDHRFFVQPSGSQQQGTGSQGADTNAAAAPQEPDGSGTAAKNKRARRRPGTFRNS